MTKLIGALLLSIFIFISLPLNAKAVVMINEISPSTDPEWIELYNDEDTNIDLGGFLLEDGNTSHSDDLPLSGTISGKGYLIFTHNKGWLNDGGDTLKLYDNSSPSAVIIDQYTYGNVNSSQSIARVPNGSENWIITENVTKGSANPDPTPTPTPQPTNSPSPSSTSTPSPTPTPTKTPTPTPTKTPTPLPTKEADPTQIPEEETISSPEAVLGAEDVQPEESSNKSSLIAFIFIAVGIIFMGVSVVLGIRSIRSSQAKNDI